MLQVRIWEYNSKSSTKAPGATLAPYPPLVVDVDNDDGTNCNIKKIKSQPSKTYQYCDRPLSYFSFSKQSLRRAEFSNLDFTANKS